WSTPRRTAASVRGWSFTRWRPNPPSTSSSLTMTFTSTSMTWSRPPKARGSRSTRRDGVRRPRLHRRRSTETADPRIWFQRRALKQERGVWGCWDWSPVQRPPPPFSTHFSFRLRLLNSSSLRFEHKKATKSMGTFEETEK
ncbi:unnamed protein product, partial [Tetraodon nigroviridis]